MTYIVATDGSEQSNDAVEYAAEHADAFDTDLEIVHVIMPEMELVDGQLVMQGQDTATDEGHRILRQAVEVAENAVQTSDLSIQTQLLTGRPSSAIADRAEAATADAIFVGHRGLSSEQEAVVGSVAKRIVSKATVPVTVVR